LGELAGRNDLWAKVGGTRKIAVPASQHPTPHIPAPPKNYGGGWGNPYNGENWIAGALFSYNPSLSDITLDGTCPVNCSNYVGRNLFSFHPGIAQAVLGDGSVRSYSESVNGQVLAYMITREKGEVVPSN